jgi:hypothetical protein
MKNLKFFKMWAFDVLWPEVEARSRAQKKTKNNGALYGNAPRGLATKQNFTRVSNSE